MSQDFYDAATYCEMDEVKRMLKADSSLMHWRDEDGFTALHGAAGGEDSNIIKFLVDNGADVNVQNNEGVSPLHICADSKIAKALIACGADIELQSKEGRTPLVELSTESEREGVIKVLLKAGANVNAKDNNGDTALSIATEREEIATLRFSKNLVQNKSNRTYKWLQPGNYADADTLFYRTHQALTAVGNLLRIHFSQFSLGLK